MNCFHLNKTKIHGRKSTANGGLKYCPLPAFVILILLIGCTGYASDTHEIILSWDFNDPSDNVTSYRIYYSTIPGAYNPTDFINVDSSLNHKDLTLVVGCIHYFVVTAVNEAGESPYSNEVFVDLNYPRPPTNLRIE
jgi:hypothetical protein